MQTHSTLSLSPTMQIQMYFSFTTLLLFSTFIFLLIIKACSKTIPPTKCHKLPPSPPKLPVIGHLHHLLGALSHQALRRIAQKYGPVLHLQLGQVPTVLISSPEAAKQAIKDQDPACADRPESIASKIMWYDYTDIAFSPYNENWRQMRKICVLELLSARNVKSFGSIRQDEVSRLVRSIEESELPINLTEMVSRMTSSITCRAAFGKVLTDRDKLTCLMKKSLAMAGVFDLADLFPSFKLLYILSWNRVQLLRMRRKLDAILDVLVDEHKSKQSGEFGGEDIVDVLLRMQGNGELQSPITNNNIKAVIIDMFTAGTETSSATVNWVMAELMRNRGVMEKVQAEVREAFTDGKKILDESDIQRLKYLKMVVKETLRLHPPIALLPRSCREECKVNGYLIPPKTQVIVNVYSLGRDPKHWDQPETFWPERFENSSKEFLGNNFEYLPFGAGRRMCPGISYGLANVELTLAQLLYHFDWSLPKGMSSDDLDMAEQEGIVVSRKEALFLVAKRPSAN